MKEKKIDTIDEEDIKLCEALRNFNHTNASAKVLVYMINKKKATSFDLETSMQLRQPEVSIGVSKLRKMGLVVKLDKPTSGKGRPTHEYSLKMTLTEIRKSLEAEADRKIKQIKEDLQILNKRLNKIN